MTTTTVDRSAVPDNVRTAAAEKQQRAARYDRASVNVEARTVELAFASDEPYGRWWGREILDCTPASVDLQRLNNRHPLLLNHDSDTQIGVIERAWVDADRKCRATVRFSRSALAEEIFVDVQDGIRELVSVGYSIDEMVLESRTDEESTYRVTRWTPHEVSIVSVPADATVGVGRSLAPGAQPAQLKENPMSEQQTAAPAATQQPDIRVVQNAAATGERQRVIDITAMGRDHQLGELAEQAVNNGTPVDEFRKTVLSKLVERGTLRPAVASPEIGLSEKEKAQYSIVRLMNALMDPNDKSAQRAAGLEIEASVAARKLRPIDEDQHLSAHRSTGFRVPHDIMASPLAGDITSANEAIRAIAKVMAKRDLNVGTASAGGNLVATDLLASSFIELLRNRMVLAGLGATMLDGLVGNLAIPSQTAGASTFWVTEMTAVTESEATFGQVAMTPKTVGMFTDYSRRAMLQTTPAVEALVRADLAAGIAVEIDRAGIAGSAAGGQPRGIINTAGIGAVAGGTNGAAPTYANMVALEEAIAIANADGNTMALLTNPRMRAQLRLTQVFASTNGTPVWASDNTVLGYPTAVTNSVPNNLVKGSSGAVCSALIMGNFSDLLFGMWGGLDLILDPYALATAGGRRIVALQDVDVAVRRAASFAAMLDALRT
jgi:HK97 family phage major capsid protein